MKRIPAFACLALLSSLMAGEPPHPAPKIPSGGMEMLAPEGLHVIVPAQKGFATAVVRHATDAPWERYWHYEITQATANPWNVQLSGALSGTIHKGDKCLLVFYARAAGEAGGKASGVANVEVKLPPEYPKLASAGFHVGPQWEAVVMPLVPMLEPKGSVGLAIHLGEKAQTIDIGGVRLLNYGPDLPESELPHPYVYYEGREEGAAWRQEALDRIEKIRKGDFQIQVVDGAGQPAADASVRVRLKRHAFGFGSAVTASWLCSQTPDGDKYRAVVDECFSKVVLENDLKTFAWDAYQDPTKKDGSYRKEWLDQALDWLREKHIPVRGHYLCWAPFEPWSEKLRGRPEELRARILNHLREEAPAVGDRVVEWDALNHPAAWQPHICIDTVLGDGFYAEVFKEARKVTKLPLWINEDQVFRPGRQQEEYYHIIEKLIQAGAKPDGIGNQAHFHSSFLPSPREMLQNSDRFAALVPQLQLTEYDVSTNGDEQLAADFTRDILILTFSHPAYTGIIMWGFWEGAHWKPEAALWRKDWSLKPSAEIWKKWVCGKWRTEEALHTDSMGKAKFRGFYGRYEMTVDQGGKTVKREVVFEKGHEDAVKVTLD